MTDQETTVVTKALENADAESLRKMVVEKENDVEMMICSLGIMLKKDKIAPRPADKSIEAIRDIALAAIELAKLVVAKADELKPVDNPPSSS